MQIEIIGGTPAFQEAVKAKMMSKGIKAGVIKTEKQAAHTPGPWSTHHDFPGRVIAGEVQTTARGQAATVVCNVMGNLLSTYKSNLRLIAAAPELLAALQRLLACPGLNLDSLEDETYKAMKEAEQAIHRAAAP